MAYRLKTNEGRAIYKKRKETVEPVVGIIKTILYFREFLLRGLKKVAIEWDLATPAYNFKRLHKRRTPRASIAENAGAKRLKSRFGGTVSSKNRNE